MSSWYPTRGRRLEPFYSPLGEEAARAYFAGQQAGDFKLTGIVDPNDSLEVDSQTGERSLQLILCGNQDGQDVCLRERFVVKPGPSDGEFDLV